MFRKCSVVYALVAGDLEALVAWPQRSSSSVECGKAVPVLLINRLYLAKRPQFPESATNRTFSLRNQESKRFTKPVGAQLERLPALAFCWIFQNNLCLLIQKGPGVEVPQRNQCTCMGVVTQVGLGTNATEGLIAPLELEAEITALSNT